MNWRTRFLAFLLACAGMLPQMQGMCAEALDDGERQRLIAISANLRCLVCKGEPLYGAHAALAQDLRGEIHAMMEQGKSDQEIRDTLVARYSDFLSYDASGTAALLWSGLAVLLLAGAAGVVLYRSRRNGRSDLPLRRY